MNLQRRSMPARRTVNRQKEQKSWTFKFCLLMYMIVVATVFFGALNYQIDLNRKTTELQRSRAAARQEIKNMEREITLLTGTRERLSSWENIKARIDEYKLPLRLAEPHQIRRISGNRLYMQNSRQANVRRKDVRNVTGISR